MGFLIFQDFPQLFEIRDRDPILAVQLQPAETFPRAETQYGQNFAHKFRINLS